jgi:hypothetical protein
LVTKLLSGGVREVPALESSGQGRIELNAPPVDTEPKITLGDTPIKQLLCPTVTEVMDRVVAIVARVARCLDEFRSGNAVRIGCWRLNQLGIECPERARLPKRVAVPPGDVVANAVAESVGACALGLEDRNA